LALDLTLLYTAEKQDYDESQKQQKLFNLAGKVKTYYHSIRDSSDNLNLTPSFWSMVTPHIPDPTARNFPVPATNLSPSVGFGAIDRIRPSMDFSTSETPGLLVES
jgi:hypothetical protein